MAKLSALVIPAVIDTSGVDKGISQIKSKLSRVGGGGGVGGVGGGLTPGHSAGIVPYGVGNGYGSGASTAMAAAFGAAAGQRSFASVAANARIGWSKNISQMNYLERQKYQLSSTGGTIMHAVGQYASNKMTYYAEQNAALRQAERGMPWRDAWMRKSNPQRLFNQERYDWWKNIRQKSNILGTTATTASLRFQNFLGGGGGLGTLGKALGIGAGIGAAYETMQHFNPENVQQRWNTSISRYAGTSSYAPLARLKQKAEIAQSEYMGFGQAFDVGGQMAAGEYGTTFTERMSNAWGAFATTTGQLAGAATTNPMYAGAMVTMPGASPALHAKMTEGIETAVGMGLLAVENTFKKLFN